LGALTQLLLNLGKL
nr:RecName: Full=Temporin-1LTa [Rana latastei]